MLIDLPIHIPLASLKIAVNTAKPDASDWDREQLMFEMNEVLAGINSRNTLTLQYNTMTRTFTLQKG